MLLRILLIALLSTRFPVIFVGAVYHEHLYFAHGAPPGDPWLLCAILFLRVVTHVSPQLADLWASA